MTKKKQKSSNGFNRHNTVIKTLPLTVINVLPQMRRSFFNIEELAQNIKKHGLINQISVAYFDKAECERHIQNINQVFGEKTKIEDLATYYGRYIVLIAGERRLRAVMALHALYPHKVKGVTAKIYSDLESEDAINLQASENTYVPPPPEEEAEFYNNYYKLLQISSGKKLSITSFAKKVGRNPSTISRALRFCMLPEEIRIMVRDKLISYGIAVELARLKEAGKKDGIIKEWALRAVIAKSKINDFRASLKRYLDETETGMFANTESDKKRGRRKVLNRETTQAFYVKIKYMHTVLRLFEENLLGSEESMFSSRGPFNAWKNLIELMETGILPHLETIIDDPYIRKILRNIKSTDLIERSKKVFEKAKQYDLVEK